jgi:hypothetical protein
MLNISQFKRAKVKGEAIGNGVLLATLIAAIGLTGCHRNDNVGETAPPANVTGQPQSPDASASATAPVAPVVAARTENGVRENLVGEVNPILTAQLHIFVQQKGRLPQSFNEFVNARLDSVPRPPAGKRWAIDSSSSEVKAVDAQ